MKKLIISTLLIIVVMFSAGCANKAQTYGTAGALIGSTAGALLFGDKEIGAAVGAGAGFLVGYVVGNEMDKYDEKQLSDLAEFGPTGETSEWKNPDTGLVYKGTISSPYTEPGDVRIKRDIKISRGNETLYGTLIRVAPGQWDYREDEI